MIRRNLPLTAEHDHWLLISQVEHARISHQLAREWKQLLPEAPSAVRDQWLAAVLHHDDGWLAWQAAPLLDDERGRPLGFTEMPPGNAQVLWSASVEACRVLGPLAGWVVASHFIALQSDMDEDFPEWAAWLETYDQQRTEWLAEWQGANDLHTQQLADECLDRLQQFDWLSLWLCCRAPVAADDPQETLELGGAKRHFGPFRFTPQDMPPAAAPNMAPGMAPNMANEQRAWPIAVDPWPFAADQVTIEADAMRVPATRYACFENVREAASPSPVKWLLHPHQSR